MKKVLIILSCMFLSVSSFSYEEIIGYKLDGKMVINASQMDYTISELKELLKDEEYDVELDLCVIYGDVKDKNPNDKFDDFLAQAGFVLILEGIYGSFGNHMFEITDAKTDEYLGAVAGIYICE